MNPFSWDPEASAAPIAASGSSEPQMTISEPQQALKSTKNSSRGRGGRGARGGRGGSVS